MRSQHKNGSRPHRFMWAGVTVGIIIALALLLWMLRKSSDPGYNGEGLAFNAVGLTVILGAPLNLLLSVLVDWITPAIHAVPGLNVFHVMLLGVIANWTLIGWMADRLYRRGQGNGPASTT